MKYYLIAIALLAAATLMELKAKYIAGDISGQIAVLSQLQPAEHDVAREKLNIRAGIRIANVLEAVAALAAIAGIGLGSYQEGREKEALRSSQSC